MSGEAQEPPVHYFVVHNEETLGPFSAGELAEGLAAGQLAAHDFVQAEGQSDWHELGALLGVPEPEMPADAAPDWPSILKWAWVRLRHSVAEQTLRVGLVCLGLGVLALALSHWPFVFWVPWFLAAAAVGILLIRGKRQTHGALVLAGALVLPLLLLLFWPKKHLPPTERVVENTPADAPSAPLPTPLPEPLTATTPASIVAPITEATPGPSLPAATPKPAPTTTQIPGLSSSAAPALPQPITPDVTPSPSRRVGEYVMATAGKLTDKMTAFFASFSKKATPEPDKEPVKEGVDWTRDYAAAFVIVKGSNGSGNGFICREGNQTWLFSNIHVVAKVKDATVSRLDGVSIVPGPAALAAGRDVARFALSDPPARPLEAITDFDAEVHAGDDVVVLGNSGVGGIVTSLRGKVTDIGPARVEVSALFNPGSSGSPIVHVRTGKVIALATYLTRRYEQFLADPSGGLGNSGGAPVRRFGYRIDKVPTWEPVNWAEFYREADATEKIALLTQDIYNFAHSLEGGEQFRCATNELRGPVEEWLGNRANPKFSTADHQAATDAFLNAFHFLTRGDIGSAEAGMRYTYFRDVLHEDKEVRERLSRDVDSQVAKFSSHSSHSAF